MALKFRRGSTADKSGSLAFGEPYVNTTLGTLQVGGNSGDLTLATIGESSAANFLSVSASTFVSASTLHITSNAEIKGNLVLGGNITIGDQTSDTVAVNANLSSSIIPSLTNTFDLGSETNAWRDLYISTGSIKIVNPGTNTVVGTLTSNASGDFKVSGQLSGSSVAGLGNAQQYSASVNSRLDSIQTTTASLLGRVSSLEVKSGSLEQSFHTYSASLNTYTESNNTTNNTQNSRLNSIESTTASLNTYTASNDSTNAGQDVRLSSLETTSGSLLTFSSSVANAIQFTGSNVTIKGDFLVKGTTTSINSTTVDIGDNIISLNGTGATNGGLIVRDATGGTTTSGSLLWDTTNDYWKAGAAGNEDKILLAQEFYIFTASNAGTHNNHSGRLDSLESTSASVNSFTASQITTQNEQNVRLTTIETTTGSLNTFTSSAASRLTSLETESGSIRNAFNLVTASLSVQIPALHSTTASLNEYTASNNLNINAIHTSTSSLNSYTSSTNLRLNSIEGITGSYATTGSNIFAGNQTISGSLLIGSNGQIRIQDNTADTLFGMYDGGNILGAYFQMWGNNHATPDLTQRGSAEFVFDTRNNGGEFRIVGFNGSGWTKYLRVTREGNTEITGSLITTNGITGSLLSTNGVVSGSSQITISDTTGYTTYSASVATLNDSTNTSLSSSIAVTDLSQNNRLSAIESRYITTGSNNFFGNQYITGSVIISQDLQVLGSSSIVYSTASQLIVEDNIIVVNASFPAERFAGLEVHDSGSNGAVTASLLWDGHYNRWIYQNSSEAHYGGAMLIAGPRNTGSLGEEQTLTNGRLPKSIGGDHIGDSIISEHSGSQTIAISGSLVVTGSILSSGTSLVSGSSQIDLTATTNYASGIKSRLNSEGVISGSSQITTLPSVDTDDLIEGATNKYYTDARVKTKLNADGVISGSSQISAGVFASVSGDITIASNGVATIGANSVALGTDTTGDYVASLVAGTNITLSNNSGEGATPTIGLTNNAITIAGTSTALGSSISAATIGNAIGAFSGSSQISHDSTTGYVANRHIDHTAVSIATGFGLSGGGDISSTRTLSVDTTGVASVSGSQTLTNKTISGASNTLSNIANASLTNSSVTVTAGTGLSGGGAVSLGSSVTLTNAGVTSNVAGTGISVSGATGAVTITNTGVTSAVAGTGVGVSAGTGAVTISIGQAVATSSNVQFNSLGVGMAASATTGRIDATNDIVAYSSSDRRFKDNIKPIEKPLEKISKISGNTFDWKEENKIEHGYEGNDVGVIAQEIEAVLPQLVQTRESGYKAVKYDKLVALLIEGIKEQQIQINDMKVEIENLKRQKGL